MTAVTVGLGAWGMVQLTAFVVAAMACLGWLFIQYLNSRKEREDMEEVIRLYLVPGAEKTTLPSLKNHTAIAMKGHNLVPAHVNGRYCYMFVDSGTTSAIMKHRRAERLGLLTQAKQFVFVRLRTWNQRAVVKMRVVEDVMVKLTDGVSFPCTFLVAPKDGPMNSLDYDIYLDNATLRRTKAIHHFSLSSSTLFFPSPMPEWESHTTTSPATQYILDVDNARFEDSVKHSNLKVLVDTGTRYFYASRKHHRPKKSVEVVVTRDSVIYWRSLLSMPSSTYDFVIGTHPLAKYSCLLDYANHYLYFWLDDRVYRAPLKRISVV